MDDATQALLVGVPGIDRDDPAIQAALAVMRLEEPQAPTLIIHAKMPVRSSPGNSKEPNITAWTIATKPCTIAPGATRCAILASGSRRGRSVTRCEDSLRLVIDQIGVFTGPVGGRRTRPRRAVLQ